MRFLSITSLLALTPLMLAGCGGVEAAAGSATADAAGEGGSAGQPQGGSAGQSQGGSAGDVGSAGGAASGAVAVPIVAPKEQWTWIPFDDAFCANGSSTGIGANITDKSSKVVIYMMAGGACWDNFTCYGIKAAVNIENGYGEAQFASDSKAYLNGSLFDRNNGDNPLKDASYFFVPYCTGDVHAGDNASAVYDDRSTMHVGFRNMTAYLKRIVATFPNAERVVLSGSSAGGFGAGFNWWQTQQAFGHVRVDMIDDSGPPLPSPYLSEALEGQWRAAWNLNATLPEGCAECQTDLSAIFGFYAANLPKNRASLLSYTHDDVIATYLDSSQEEIAKGLGVLAGKLDGYANTRYYYVDGSSHGLLGNPGGVKQNGVVLLSWIAQQLRDDPNWKSVKP